MLEKIEGVPIDIILTAVATAAGLSGTALTPGSDNAMPAPFSHGYLDQRGVDQLEEVGIEGTAPQDVTDWSVSWGGAGGAMYSTIAISARGPPAGWERACSPPTWPRYGSHRRRRPARTSAGTGSASRTSAIGWIGHGGQIFGWTSLAMYDTDTGDTLVVLTNSTGSFDATGGPVAEIFPELKQVFG